MQKDFATGKEIDLLQPEEQVRQDYERLIVKDYGYPKSHLDIEVLVQMGSSKKRCDIAVYDSSKKKNIIGIVEVKPPKTPDGKEQLESYMAATSTCRWGVLTNGETTHYAVRGKEGIEFSPSFSVPRYGESGASILKYNNLIEASNLKWIFRHIKNRLYANTNLPRSERQGAEMVRFIFSKLADEYNGRKHKSTIPAFQIKIGESVEMLRSRINRLWDETKNNFLGQSIFEESEQIRIDDYSLELIVSELQRYSLLKTDRDVVGDAFEVFAEPQLAGEKGQFFTPRKVVNMVIEMVDPREGEIVIDPACGSGGFLIAAFKHMTREIPNELKSKIAEHSLYGIDKESDLVKVCKAQMAILGDGKSNVVEADSLKHWRQWSDIAKSKIVENGRLKQFDVVLTNPPFGSKIKVERPEVLANYNLGYQWKKRGGGGMGENEQDTKNPTAGFVCRKMS